MIQGKVFEKVNVTGNIFPVILLSLVKTDTRRAVVISAVQLSNDFYSRHGEICRWPSPDTSIRCHFLLVSPTHMFQTGN